MSLRYIENDIIELAYTADKMAFVAGPRQSGKTTMAKHMLDVRKHGAYYNWDDITFRRQWVKDPNNFLLTPKRQKKPLIVLDEIHKAKLWKRQLKGIYDTQVEPNDILVIGSARLNVYRKGSDSLMGRYYHFRLHPFSYAEMLGNKYTLMPDELIDGLLCVSVSSKAKQPKEISALFQYGPFPEPLFAQSKKRLNIWRRGRVEKIIREDLRDISRLPELSQIEMLVSLLPDRVASPLSTQSLSEDLEVAYTTVRRWLNYLHELYYFFELKPYSKSLPRSIKREGKLYLWDWSEIQDEGARFENMVASHFHKYCHYLTDTGEGTFDLKYIRNKRKQEIDFLILRDNKPWLPIEVKLGDTSPSKNWKPFMKFLKCPCAIQVVYKQVIHQVIKEDGYSLIIISADLLLKFLV